MTMRSPHWSTVGLCVHVQLCLLIGLLVGCGSLSRTTLAAHEFGAVYQQPEQLARLRGREPGMPGLWLESARLQLAVAGRDRQAPTAALAIVEDGLRWHPSSTDLLITRIELLAMSQRFEEALDAVERALSAPQPAATREFLTQRALTLALQLRLARGEFDTAAALLQRLGGRGASDPTLLAGGWSQIALERAAAGDGEGSLEAFDQAIAQGASLALQGLAFAGQGRPQRQAAARALRRQAQTRQPLVADFALAVALDQMEAADLQASAATLASVPEELPARLVADREALLARQAILEGDIAGGLERLGRRLDADPLDGPALAILEETWRLHGRPDNATLADRLWRARRALPAHAVRDLADIDALLDQLEPVGPPAPTGDA